ncbi:MAG: hypothetical protein GXX08_12325 [Firmicutes bacterium]|jgi:lysozyme family protein|nr:hypothetical protein [Bacillota bacterium]
MSMDAEARFHKAVEVVLAHEGGFVNHKSDPGGATNFGISLRYLQKLGIEVGDIDQDGDVDIDDIKKLTPERAKERYRHDWWDKYGYGKITDGEVATKVLDLSVNIGPSAAHKVLQRALHASRRRDVKVDGILGPKTLAAVNSVNSVELIGALRAEAAAFYRQLVMQNPNLAVFEKGWLNRAYA